MDWVGDFGLYRGHVIEIQILKQYYAQYYAYVKQNTDFKTILCTILRICKTKYSKHCHSITITSSAPKVIDCSSDELNSLSLAVCIWVYL